MVKEIHILLIAIKLEFAEHDIVKILMYCSQNIANALANQKSSIGSNLKNKNWDKIQKRI